MADLFQLDTVKYICCCGSLKPICSIYFCRHCLRLRCHYCVSHEVDSLFCGNCSENMPSAEAKQKRNKCNSCHDCPSCFQTLSIRSYNAPAGPTSGQGDQGLEKQKRFYLVCNFCRWSSRDAGIPDQPNPTGPWPEQENPMEKEIGEMGDYFRVLALREKNTKERKFVHKSKFLAAGRHGLAHLLPKRFPISNLEELVKEPPRPDYTPEPKTLNELEDELQACKGTGSTSKDGKESKEDSEESEEQRRMNFFEMELDLAKVTNIEQRLKQLDIQPTLFSGLLPIRKKLLVKRSLRCRVCERNISKPDYSPVSIKFKIQLNAYYHVPHVRLLVPPPLPLVPGSPVSVTLRLANPTQFPILIKFSQLHFTPLSKADQQAGGLDETLIISPGKTGAEESSTDPGSMPLSKEIHVLPIRNERFEPNVELVPMGRELVLSPKDETSDFDDFGDTPDFNDDPNFVPWRRANKAAVILEVLPKEGVLTSPPLLGLSIEYDYVNTIVALENKISQEPQKVRLEAHLLIALDSVPE